MVDATSASNRCIDKPWQLGRPTRGPRRPRHRGHSSIATLGRQAGNIGIGFAIPVDDAAAIAERIIAE
jgi:hypothetical protein